MNGRGRPKKSDKDLKKPVALVRLSTEDRITLETLANLSHVSVYKYIERLIMDRLEEYRDYISDGYDDYDIYGD